MQRHWAWGLSVTLGLMAGCVPVSVPTPQAATVPVATPTPSDQAGAPAGLETWAESVSPDGAWRAESVAAFPADRDQYYQRLTVARTDGQMTWTPVEEWSRLALGYTVAVPVAWSNAGDALYFTHRPVPDGCALFVNGWGLLRLDLTSGAVTEVLPGQGLALALSPAQDQVAEVVDGPPVLVIHDLDTGASRTLPLSTEAAVQAGSLVWSPDGTQVALALAHDPCAGGWARATSLLMVDVETLEISVLVAEDDRLFQPVEWPEADAILLEGEGGARFSLNPETGEITPVA